MEKASEGCKGYVPRSQKPRRKRELTGVEGQDRGRPVRVCLSGLVVADESSRTLIGRCERSKALRATDGVRGNWTPMGGREAQ